MLQQDRLIPKTTSATLEPEKGRDYAAKELVSSERSYIYNLELCLTAIYLPIKDKAHAKAHSNSAAARLTRRKEKFITLEELDIIFGTLDRLFHLHKDFLVKLEDRVADWTADSVLADIFLTETDFFSEYPRYANHFSLASNTLLACRQRKEFQAFMEHLEFSVGVMLPSFMIMPIQRLPRYELLLKELLKHTPETSKDFVNIPRALKQLKKHTKKTNIAVLCSLSKVSEEFKREEGIKTEEGVKLEESDTSGEDTLTSEVSSSLLSQTSGILSSGELEEAVIAPNNNTYNNNHNTTATLPPTSTTKPNGGTLKLERPDRSEGRRRPASLYDKREGNSLDEISSLHSSQERERSFSTVSEDAELTAFTPHEKKPHHPHMSKTPDVSRKTKRLSLIFQNSKDKHKEKEKEKDKAATFSAFFVEDFNRDDSFSKAEAAEAVAVEPETTKRGKRRSFRLTWSSLGDFKETIATSFQEFQQEEELAKKRESEAPAQVLENNHDYNNHYNLNTIKEEGASVVADTKEKGKSKTKEEKEAEKERRRSLRRSKDMTGLTTSAPPGSSPSSTKLGRFMGSMLDMRRSHNKGDSADWKKPDLRDKIETLG